MRRAGVQARGIYPSSRATTATSRAQISSHSACVGASTITRTRGSVPEGRTRTRPLPSSAAPSRSTASQTALAALSGRENEILRLRFGLRLRIATLQLALMDAAQIAVAQRRELAGSTLRSQTAAGLLLLLRRPGLGLLRGLLGLLQEVPIHVTSRNLLKIQLIVGTHRRQKSTRVLLKSIAENTLQNCARLEGGHVWLLGCWVAGLLGWSKCGTLVPTLTAAVT